MKIDLVDYPPLANPDLWDQHDRERMDRVERLFPGLMAEMDRRLEEEEK